jgi:hypothetical protein
MKKKHASQIREAYREKPDWVPDDIEPLYFIGEWQALLCRRKDNGYYLVVQVAAYYHQHQKFTPFAENKWSHKQAQIAEQLKHLPQLFLD